jgi:hypothetical protein
VAAVAVGQALRKTVSRRPGRAGNPLIGANEERPGPRSAPKPISSHPLWGSHVPEGGRSQFTMPLTTPIGDIFSIALCAEGCSIKALIRGHAGPAAGGVGRTVSTADRWSTGQRRSVRRREPVGAQ